MRYKTVAAMLDNLWDGKWKEYLPPLCFTLAGITNFIFYYLGFAYVENPVRQYGFAAARILFAVLCGLLFLASLRHGKLPGKTWVLVGFAAAFFAFSFAEGLRRVGYNEYWFEYFTHAVCFVLPVFLAGICCALSHSERVFLRRMEQLSFLLLPGALVLFNFYVFDVSPATSYAERRRFGVMLYMFVANSIMPVLLAHMLCFAQNADWKLPLIGRKATHPQLLRAGFILIYWVVIIGTGTRGIIFSVLGFCIVWIISSIRSKDYFCRAFCLSLATCGLFVFLLTVYAPPAMEETGISRTRYPILNAVETGEINTSFKEDERLLEGLDEIVESSEICPFEVKNRITLFRLAWKEFLKSPLTGMGLSGYAVKYGKYPHNVILEALAEMGALGALYLALVAYTVIRVCREAGRDAYVKEIVLFLIAYAGLANISGSIWMCEALAFGLGLGLTQEHSPKSK